MKTVKNHLGKIMIVAVLVIVGLSAVLDNGPSQGWHLVQM